MNANDFVRLAKFPPNWKEAHLQDYIDRRLIQLGYKTETEVWCGENCGRADIVADPPNKPDYPGDVIEVKKWLTREEIFQARGQAESYQKLIKSSMEGRLRNITVIGMAPIDAEEYRKAQVAQKLCLQSGIDVIFINEEEIFYPSHARAIEQTITITTPQPSAALQSIMAHANNDEPERVQQEKEEYILNLNYPFGKLCVKYKQNSHYINDAACGIGDFVRQVVTLVKVAIKIIKSVVDLIIKIYLFFKRLNRKKYTSYKKKQAGKILKIIWMFFGIFYLFVASIEFSSKINTHQSIQRQRK